MMNYYRVSPKPDPPVTLAEAKEHLRVVSSNDDNIISSLIDAATDMVERYTNRQLIETVWALEMKTFPSEQLPILKSPVSSIESIEYRIEGSETLSTVAPTIYMLENTKEIAFLSLKPNNEWPSDIESGYFDSVKIQFKVGYGTSADDVPNPFKAAIKLIVANLYENRGDEGHRTIPKTVEFLIEPYKLNFFV